MQKVRRVLLPRLLEQPGAARAVDRAQRRRELGRPGDDAQVGLVDAAELVRVGVDVNQGLLRARRLEQ